MCSRFCDWLMGNCLPISRREEEEDGLGVNEHPTGSSTPPAQSPHQVRHRHRMQSTPTTSASSVERRSIADIPSVQTNRRVALLQHLPTGVYSEDSKADKECIICMEELTEGERIRYLPCMHSYHVSCIDDWLTRKFQCPSCMEPVESGLFSSFTVAPEMNVSELLRSSPAAQATTPHTSGAQATTTHTSDAPGASSSTNE